MSRQELRQRAWFLSLASILFLLLNVVPALAEMPKLVLSDPIFDFGEVAEGAVIEHSFRISNAGDEALKIRKIHPACGCTAVVLDSDTIAPGEGTVIKASFNTSGFQGYKVKTVRLYTNDPEQTSAVLTIQGTVRPDVEVVPPRLHFGNITRGEPQTLSASVLLDPATSLKITEVVSRSKDLEIGTEDVSENGRVGKKVTVTFTPKSKLGSYRNRVEVKTTSVKNPVVNIPIFAYIEGDVSVEPNSLSFGLLEGPLKKPAEATAVLKFQGGNASEIVSVRSSNPSVEVEHSPLDEAGSHMIKVRIKKNSSGVIRAGVTITTDHSDSEQRNVSLPVYAIISRAGS